MKTKNQEAMEAFNRIETGKHAAVSRPRDPRSDRVLRKMIEEAQSNGDIIINLGDGYYRPDFSKPDEVQEYRHYIAQKESRITAHQKTINGMQKAVREKGIPQ